MKNGDGKKDRKNLDIIDKDKLAKQHGYENGWDCLDDSSKLAILEKLLDKAYHDFISYDTNISGQLLFVLYNMLQIQR
jgi:hypothetical protein